MATINMSQAFDIRIRFQNQFQLRSLKDDATFQTHIDFETNKTYKLSIRKTGNDNILEIQEVTTDPSGNFVAFINSSDDFSCYFFQEFVGIPLAGVIGIGDVRPVTTKELRITKLDASFEAYLKFTLDSNGVHRCSILDSATTVNRLDTFATSGNQVFFKILT